MGLYLDYVLGLCCWPSFRCSTKSREASLKKEKNISDDKKSELPTVDNDSDECGTTDKNPPEKTTTTTTVESSLFGNYASNLIGQYKPINDLSEKKMSSLSGLEQSRDDNLDDNHNNNNSDHEQSKKSSSNSQNAPSANSHHALAGSLSPSTATVTTTTFKEASSKFKIRTRNRRHLDFDDEYDLGDVRAKSRTRWSGAFHFIQAADSQLGMIDSYVHKRTEPGWKEEIELCEELVRTCNRMEPRPLFMIICGDLVDSLPTSEIGSKQVVDFKRIFNKLDPRIPLVCVCGNHDIGNEPTVDNVLDYRRTFGDDYYYFTKNDCLFIVINSQFYQHRDFVQEMASEQDKWLEYMLDKCKLFKYSIVFEHIPWFLEKPDEEDDYFNIRKEVRLDWLRKFKQAGVTKIMCGHYHRNAGGWFEGMELVVTSAIGAQCGSDKSGARIVRVLENTIEHQYYAMPELPLKIEL